MTTGDASSVSLTLAFGVVACRLLLSGWVLFAACSPPIGRLVASRSHYRAAVPAAGSNAGAQAAADLPVAVTVP
jgi:hypothetical protein